MVDPRRLRAALLAATLLLLAGCGDDGDEPSSKAPASATTTAATSAGPELGPAFGSMSSLPGALNSGPPWPANNAVLQRRLRTIGLAPLTEEGQVVHIHQHLNIFVDDQPVEIPANIGIDAKGAFISDLHTHEKGGVIHVESPTQQSFSLGQFFAVWGVPLGPDCIANLCKQGEKELRAWADGKPVNVDPTRIVLSDHQELVIAYGTEEQVPDPIPTTYDWASAGL